MENTSDKYICIAGVQNRRGGDVFVKGGGGVYGGGESGRMYYEGRM